MDIPTRVQILRDTVRQALVFMMDKQPLDSNRVQWSNNHIMKQADALFTIQGNSPEEEAELCSVLLMSYQVLNEHNPDKDPKSASRPESLGSNPRSAGSFLTEMRTPDLLLWGKSTIRN